MLFGFEQNPQYACHDQAKLLGLFSPQTFIQQHKPGLGLLRQYNGFRFALVQVCQLCEAAGIGERYNVNEWRAFQNIRLRTGTARFYFSLHRWWDPNRSVQRFQQIQPPK